MSRSLYRFSIGLIRSAGLEGKYAAFFVRSLVLDDLARSSIIPIRNDRSRMTKQIKTSQMRRREAGTACHLCNPLDVFIALKKIAFAKSQLDVGYGHSRISIRMLVQRIYKIMKYYELSIYIVQLKL